MTNITGQYLLAAFYARAAWAEFHNPSADSLVQNINPSFLKHLFDLAKADVETEIQPNSGDDDLAGGITTALKTD
ncbi:hypothetical protein [Shimia thalassica]|uniref:hypothetical protein n=1 Tax=Shimia thalassica TaxID=1715693 RepID=UPI0026E2B4A0|nr:hypothetical protein [Shimia thalassica]